MHLTIYILVSIIFVILWKCRKLFFSFGINPFLEDSRKPVRDLVVDQKKRDDVIKNGFKEEKVPKELDAIIIGSGIGGLCTAAILAKTGKRVLVLEQHDQAGGCCHTFIDKGYEFDVGIHYIGEVHYQSVMKTLIDQISDGQIQWEYLSEDFDCVVIKDKKTGKQNFYPVYADVEKQKSNLKKFFPDEETAIEAFYKIIPEATSGFQRAMALKFMPLWLVDLLVKFGLVHKMTNFFKMNEKTLKEVVDSITTNQELKDVFSYCFGDFGTLPSKTGFPMQAFLMQHFAKGASYPVGGASEIAHSIIPVIERGGGKVLVRARVMNILVNSEGRANGVKVKHGNQETDLFAPLIISDAGVLNTCLRLLPREIMTKSYLSKFCKKERAIPAISLFVGLDASAEELEITGKKNFWVFSKENIDQNCEDYIKLSKERVEDEEIPMLFVSFPSTKDPTWDKRYPGKTTMAVVTFTKYEWFKEWEKEPCKRRSDDYEGFKKTLGWKLIDQVAEIFPKIKDHIDYVDIGTPLTNNFYIGSNEGEIYGLDHDQARFRPNDFALLRPATDIPGLFLTGQDVCTCGFGGALFGGLVSAQQILGRNVLFDLIKLHKKNKTDKKLE